MTDGWTADRRTRHRFQRKPLVSDPGMHHGTCVTNVSWCMSGSLTCDGGENFPAFPEHSQPTILRIWQEARCMDIMQGTRIVVSVMGTSEFYSELDQYLFLAAWWIGNKEPFSKLHLGIGRCFPSLNIRHQAKPTGTLVLCSSIVFGRYRTRCDRAPRMWYCTPPTDGNWRWLITFLYDDL